MASATGHVEEVRVVLAEAGKGGATKPRREGVVVGGSGVVVVTGIKRN